MWTQCTHTWPPLHLWTYSQELLCTAAVNQRLLLHFNWLQLLYPCCMLSCSDGWKAECFRTNKPAGVSARMGRSDVPVMRNAVWPLVCIAVIVHEKSNTNSKKLYCLLCCRCTLPAGSHIVFCNLLETAHRDVTNIIHHAGQAFH